MLPELAVGYEPERLDIHRSDLPTPSVALDLAAFSRNAHTMATIIRGAGTRWRPHVKAHRSPYLARLQREAGADGVTCGSLGDAEAFVGAGIDDVLLANVLGSAAKWERLARLERQARVTACVDDPIQVQRAARAAAHAGVVIPLYVEVDVGLGRAGLTSVEAAVEMAVDIARNQSLELAGVMGYEGHCMSVWPLEEKVAACMTAITKLLEVVERLEVRGVATPAVSCGGTGTYPIVAGIDGVTEIQAGGGCLHDVLYEEAFHVAGHEHALVIESEVVSRPTNARVIADAGLGAISAHRAAMPRTSDGLRVAALSAEHATLEADVTGLPSVGDRLSLIPGRIDTTVLLHDRMYLVSGDKVTGVIGIVRPGS